MSLTFSSFLQVVNSLSPQGQLPLGIALMSRSSSIAQTLLQSGKADVNAYNGDVSTLSMVSSILGFFQFWILGLKRVKLQNVSNAR